MAENKVKSFEVSGDEAVGDIISRDRKAIHHRLKVGVLPVAWFEWWPMFPNSDMEAQIKADGERLVSEMRRRFGADYEIIAPEEIVDTLDKAYDAINSKFGSATIVRGSSMKSNLNVGKKYQAQMEQKKEK